MQDIQHFIDQHFWLFFVLCFLWVVLVSVSQYFRLKKHFPPVARESIRFDERYTAGWSHQTMFTQMLGRGIRLHVTVTDSEVWVRPELQFSSFASLLDLEHRIPRLAITRAEQSSSSFFSSLFLEYRDEDGQLHQLSLRLRRPDDFLQSLSLQPRRTSGCG